MLDLIIEAIGALLEFVWTDWRPTPRQRVKRALRLSRKRNLSGKTSGVRGDVVVLRPEERRRPPA